MKTNDIAILDKIVKELDIGNKTTCWEVKQYLEGVFTKPCRFITKTFTEDKRICDMDFCVNSLSFKNFDEFFKFVKELEDFLKNYNNVKDISFNENYLSFTHTADKDLVDDVQYQLQVESIKEIEDNIDKIKQ